MASNPIVWFEIYVQDLNRARKFYETVLATTLEKVEGDTDESMWMFPCKDNTMGAGGMIVKMEGVSPGCGGTLVYFACDDCAVEEGRVVASGGEIIKSKFSIAPHGFIAIVKDTEGNPIGLHSMK